MPSLLRVCSGFVTAGPAGSQVLGHHVLKSHVALGTLATVAVFDYDPPKLLLATPEYRSCLGGQDAITRCTQEVGVVVHSHRVTLAVESRKLGVGTDGIAHDIGPRSPQPTISTAADGPHSHGDGPGWS
jgi:hypothetical protein